MTTAPHSPAPKAPPSQTDTPPLPVAPPPFARVAGGFKSDTWQVGLGAGWRS